MNLTGMVFGLGLCVVTGSTAAAVLESAVLNGDTLTLYGSGFTPSGLYQNEVSFMDQPALDCQVTDVVIECDASTTDLELGAVYRVSYRRGQPGGRQRETVMDVVMADAAVAGSGNLHVERVDEAVFNNFFEAGEVYDFNLACATGEPVGASVVQGLESDADAWRVADIDYRHGLTHCFPYDTGCIKVTVEKLADGREPIQINGLIQCQ